MAAPYDTEEEYYKWGILRRINSVGMLWNKPSDAWIGIDGLKSEERNKVFNSLLEEGKITEIIIKGMKHASK